VDNLLAHGYHGPSVLDISSTALAVARARLGGKSAGVDWLCGDVTKCPFVQHAYDVWHDRAVFHFLADANQRAAYIRQVANAVRPGGHIIVATFGPEGPTSAAVLRLSAMALMLCTMNSAPASNW
jgi:SAM-dependent methyltransferase